MRTPGPGRRGSEKFLGRERSFNRMRDTISIQTSVSWRSPRTSATGYLCNIFFQPESVYGGKDLHGIAEMFGCDAHGMVLGDRLLVLQPCSIRMEFTHSPSDILNGKKCEGAEVGGLAQRVPVTR